MVEKDTARILVSKYLKQGEFGSCYVSVRINGVDTEYWKDDLAAIVPNKRLDGIRVPKVEDAGTVKIIDEELSRLEEKTDFPSVNSPSTASSKPRTASGTPMK
nr:aldolase/citrate lyase family protein [Cloacibacillus evryensis]